MVRRRRRRRHGGEHENEERWLLTYADMITLLMALFMVLFSISSVNVSKLKSLQQSLHNAFSAHVLPGGQALMQTGGDNSQKLSLPETPSVPQSVTAAANAAAAAAATAAATVKAALAEQKDFQDLKREVDAAARRAGLSRMVSTRVTERGLVIEILTDGLLFDSGQAVVKPAGLRLLDRIAPLLRRESVHQLIVQGHTDSVPIRNSIYPSNWELSTARASAVVRVLLGQGIAAERLEASGRAYLDPVASNATAAGRRRNRRVDILLPRLSVNSPDQPVEPAAAGGGGSGGSGSSFSDQLPAAQVKQALR